MMQLLECVGKGPCITGEIMKTKENITHVGAPMTHIQVMLPLVVRALEECFPHHHKTVPHQIGPLLPHFEVQKDESANI